MKRYEAYSVPPLRRGAPPRGRRDGRYGDCERQAIIDHGRCSAMQQGGERHARRVTRFAINSTEVRG